jgi:pyridoxal phosphate enzyme (YggS family)
VSTARAEVLANLAEVRHRLAAACERAGRSPDAVRIVAAAKTIPAAAVGWVVEAGVVDVGHNYVQELRAMRPVVSQARWHFIGTLQASSAHHVAAAADVVETLASLRAVERLARRAAAAGRRIDALIEVDLTGERSGVRPEDLDAFARTVATSDGLALVGLMTLPPIPTDREDARPFFVRLRDLRDRVRTQHPEVVELSMGMSLDYEVAAEEGATMVRIGTALFGPRTPQ